MSDNHTTFRFSPTAAPDRFVKGEKLAAQKLNDTLQSVVNTAFLIASAPPVPGMFRPWWWREEANHIDFDDETNTIKVNNLFVTLKSGLPLFVEHEKARFDGDNVEVFLTEKRKLVTRPAGDELADWEGLRIATRRRGVGLRIDVPVAEFGATADIRAADERVCRAVGVWFRTAVGKSQDFDFLDRLARLRSGDVLPERQIRSLSEVAAAVRRRLGESPGINLLPHEFEVLVQPPESMARDILHDWLTKWAKTFESKAVRHSFFNPVSELKAELSPGPKYDQFWYEFDISLWNAAKVELLSDRLLHKAKFSFNNFKGRTPMATMISLSGGRFSVSLDCPSSSTSLNVLADGKDIDLRLRPVKENFGT